MEQVLQLAILVFAALATGGLMVNWVGLGRAMPRLLRLSEDIERLNEISRFYRYEYLQSAAELRSQFAYLIESQ